MEGALRLAAKHGLSAGMHKICTTGGGAQKVRRSLLLFLHLCVYVCVFLSPVTLYLLLSGLAAFHCGKRSF